MKKYLCIDCGGTFVKYAVIAEDEAILIQDKFPTECEDFERFKANIRAVYDRHCDVCGIAMSLPGLIDAERGFAHTGGAIVCLAEKNIEQEISQLCGGLPVSIENDAKAAAYAEVMSGALKDCNDGVVIVIGTALGGTVVIDRKIIRGSHLFAGELSYVYYSNEHVTDNNFANCHREHEYKGRGLYTDRCTPKRICQIYSELTNRCLNVTDSPWLFEQARKGDRDALTAIRVCCRDLAMLVFNVQCVVDPEVVAIGGGISSDSLFIEILQEEVATYADHIVPGAPTPVVKACKYGNNANLLGALHSHRNKFS